MADYGCISTEERFIRESSPRNSQPVGNAGRNCGDKIDLKFFILLASPSCWSREPRDNFRMSVTPCKVATGRVLLLGTGPISAKPRKPIVSLGAAAPANFWNDTCTRIRSTWLTCTRQANYWETIHALNVLTHFPIWILLRFGRKSSLSHVGLPRDEQTLTIKQRESFPDTSMTMTHCTAERSSVGMERVSTIVRHSCVLRPWNCAPLNAQSPLIVTSSAHQLRTVPKNAVRLHENSLVLPCGNSLRALLVAIDVSYT